MNTLIDGKSPFKEEATELVKEAGLAEIAEQLPGPFAELSSALAETFWLAIFPSAQTNSLHWPLLVLTLVIAVFLYYLRGGRGAKDGDGVERKHTLWGYLFPKSVYLHHSARVDIGLYLIDKLSMPFWVLAFLGALAPWLEGATMSTLRSVFGPSPEMTFNMAWGFAYGLVMFLVVDMTFFFTHLMMHRTKIGWAIHKVHHSAEVLTPLTRYREHFIAAPIWASTYLIGFVITGSVFAWLFNGNITTITVMNMSVFSFLYALNGNFRHHHISFRYPRWLEYWLQSPGMHHTHHSTLRHHWDSNLGLATSIWDRMFGTLYIAERFEATPWGLPPQDQAQYSSLRQNLSSPFVEIWCILSGKSTGKQPQAAAEENDQSESAPSN